MKLEMLALCNSATVGGMGELNVLGATNQLLAFQAPQIMAHSAIVAKVRFEKIEEGKKNFIFSIVDMDGRPIVPIRTSQPFDVKIPPDATSVSAGSVLYIQPLILPKFGEYRIDLAVNETWVGSTPVFLRKVEHPQMWQPPQPPPPQSA